MNYYFIMNPGSGGGKSQAKIKQIIAELDKAGIEYEHALTTSLQHSYELSVQANKQGYPVIVAVGGDGTINRVLNGFYDRDGRRISRAKLGVIHTGSSPDFCKSYEIPLQADKALKTVLEGRSKNITLGKITSCSESTDINSMRTDYFACCANIGLGPLIARGSNSGIRKYLGDTLGTLLTLLSAVLMFRPANLTIIIDGHIKVLKGLYNLSVGKTKYIASGIKLKHELTFSDERFYILVVKDLKLLKLPSVLKKIYSGKGFANSATISLDYTKAIEVYQSTANNEVECDGDPIGYLPCRIEPAAEMLELICEGL